MQARPKGTSLMPLAFMFKLSQLGLPLRACSPNALSGVVLSACASPRRSPPGTGALGRGSTAPTGCFEVLNSPAGQGTAKVS